MQLVVNISPGLRKYLQELCRSGLYGSTIEDVALRLIEKELEKLAREGLFRLDPARKKKKRK